MKKLTLLTTTALVAGYFMTATPANAADQGWFASMQESVKSWFADEPQTTAEVETYLDEVTIAVPPMTGAEAASIQPAAGDYVEDAVEIPAVNAAPGSNQFNDETSFNTEFGTQDNVTAFGDSMNADDLANIMPAAGDAEEINEEAVIMVENDAELNTEATAEVSTSIDETVEATKTEVAADVKDAEAEIEQKEAQAKAQLEAEQEEMAKTVDALSENNEESSAAAKAETDLENLTPAAGAETQMDVNVDVNENITTGTNAGSVGVDASVTNDANLDAQ